MQSEGVGVAYMTGSGLWWGRAEVGRGHSGRGLGGGGRGLGMGVLGWHLWSGSLFCNGNEGIWVLRRQRLVSNKPAGPGGDRPNPAEQPIPSQVVCYLASPQWFLEMGLVKDSPWSHL